MGYRFIYRVKKREFLNKPTYNCVLGNYLKMINDIDDLGGLTPGKKRELLLDGGRGDLVFNKKKRLTHKSNVNN